MFRQVHDPGVAPRHRPLHDTIFEKMLPKAGLLGVRLCTQTVTLASLELQLWIAKDRAATQELASNDSIDLCRYEEASCITETLPS